MINENLDKSLSDAVSRLAQQSVDEQKMTPCCGTGYFPSVPALKEAMDLVKEVIFPDFLERRRLSATLRTYNIGVGVERIHILLAKEIRHALGFDCEMSEKYTTEQARNLATQFIETLPSIKRLLYKDIQAVYNNDPAVDNYGEIILCYPVVTAMVHYRVAHSLLQLGVPVIPRVLTELAHSETGIDINPGAQIGEYFAIDHGTGVVIGETCIIGDHVTLYQGVTLGAKNFTLDESGHPINTPRHPIIEDNVTIYSNASVLGRITVGAGSVIGGNVWLTNSVPAGSRILQRKAVSATFTDGAGI
ncbi:MAG: serine O-acetyltransferase [Muribaculaceae bacterium]|nr:serine O-acetyltransferase [Muribaculaceae bacterium]